MRFWKPEDIFEAPCPHCGARMEFWKDDVRRRCKSCGEMVRNARLDLGCAKWCKHAKECLGYDPKSMNADEQRHDSTADQLIAAVKKEFGADQKRITHALQVLERAEEIMRDEGGQPRVVIAAALLHDIGIHEAERKHGSSAPEYQEAEGPPIVRRILEQRGFDEKAIEEVCRIVGSHHTGGEIDTVEFRIIWDADHIVNLSQQAEPWDPEQVEQTIEKVFRTRMGKETFRKALQARGRA
jgi:predicted HD phosphohydrolase